nr:MAG TPA: hypothetical protein [Caudoviricetes sp.]
MSRILDIGKSVLLSGGVINHGSLEGYITDNARRALGMGASQFQDGQVHYFSKNKEILKRAAIQTVSQLAYGTLRSYPRYLKYLEQKQIDKYLQTKSQTSIANKSGQYYKLISEQQAVAEKKKYTDSVVGHVIKDYLELKISEEGVYFDSQSGKVEPNSKYGLISFVDLQPQIQISSKNNILLTTVQGRDYSRKELISGGDLEINISGKITSKYPEVYPESEVNKFIKIIQYKGVIDCDNTILRQFNISRLIILNYTFPSSEYRNIQPYTISCVAVEPSEAVELKLAEQEKVDDSIADKNKWIKIARIGTQIVDPSSLLKLTKLWI